jgi:hypothetical protein
MQKKSRPSGTPSKLLIGFRNMSIAGFVIGSIFAGRLAIAGNDIFIMLYPLNTWMRFTKIKRYCST